MFFLNSDHQKRYETVDNIESGEYRAALYLIAADASAWAEWERTDNIPQAARKIELGDLARNLFNSGGRKKVSALDICRLDDKLFKVAIEAMRIRHGL